MIELLRFLRSDIALYVLPLIAVPATALIVAYQYWRASEFDIAKAIAIGASIPVGLAYFAFFGNLRDWLSFIKVFAPQAFILCVMGSWFLFKSGCGRDVGPISALAVVNVVIFGHLWTVMTVSAVR
jgi:hypothetical protein